MSYHGLGAGPGPTKTYYVDLPFPFGKDTGIVLPLDAVISDVWAVAKPRLESELSTLYPMLVKKFEGSLPDLADQFVGEVQPDVDRILNRVLMHGYVIGGCLLGGLAYLAWRSK